MGQGLAALGAGLEQKGGPGGVWAGLKFFPEKGFAQGRIGWGRGLMWACPVIMGGVYVDGSWSRLEGPSTGLDGRGMVWMMGHGLEGYLGKDLEGGQGLEFWGGAKSKGRG